MEETPVACWEAGRNSCGRRDHSTAANTDDIHGNVGAMPFRCNGDPVTVVTEGGIDGPTLGAKAGQKGGSMGT